MSSEEADPQSSPPRRPDGRDIRNRAAPVLLGTLTLDADALREALIEALTDPRVLEKLAAAHAARGRSVDGSLPRFMSAKEYAKHARISPRTLDYERHRMTEGVHFSRTGSRVRFHVKEADDFVSQSKRGKRVLISEETELKELARKEAARRRVKPTTEKR